MENRISFKKQKSEPFISPPEDVDAQINFTGNSPLLTNEGDLGQEGRRVTAKWDHIGHDIKAFSKSEEPDDMKLGDVDKVNSYTEINVSKQNSYENRALLQIKINESDAGIGSNFGGSGALFSPTGNGRKVIDLSSAGNSPIGSPGSRNHKRTESVFADLPRPAFHKEIVDKGPIGMSAVGKTLVFPRVDNIYKGK